MNFPYLKIILSLLICCFVILKSTAANIQKDIDTLKVFYKVENGKILIRWLPSNDLQWKKGLQKGYILEKYLLNRTETDNPQLVFKTKQPILPMEYNHWKSNADNQDEQLILLRDLIYFDQMDETLKSEHYPPEVYSVEKRNKSRFLFSNFIQNGNFTYSLYAGLGFLDTEVKDGELYLYKIYPASENADRTVSVIIDPKGYKEKPLPELQCDFGSEEVEFTWNTKDFVDGYYGYSLSQSDDGIHFKALSETPFFNLYDHLDTAGIFDNFYYKTPLAEKDKTYWFKLSGADYFGGMSEDFAICSGEGYEPVNFSPAITNTIQTDSNYAFIEWKLLSEYENLIEEFQVFRSDSMDGIYRPVLTGIDKQERSITVKMEKLANYYRIVAVAYRGPKVSSFPALVMGIDETPPITPANFNGTIDSSGIARFSWTPNTEEDLDGYIVFKSYVKDADFARITSRPIKTNSFIDTVNMQSGNELVYYKLQAIDKVNNRSPFTAILEIKKADRFPPVEPHIHAIKNFSDRIEVRWHNSGSKDVVLHRLFRKNLETEKDWALLAEYGSVNPAFSYIDKDIKAGNPYAYTLIAVDDGGLESLPAQIAIGKPVDYKLQEGIKDIHIVYIEKENKVKINWDYDVGVVCELLVYKGSNEARPSLMSSISGESMEFVDSHIKKGNIYTYYIKTSCEDGTRSPFSPKVEIVIPE